LTLIDRLAAGGSEADWRGFLQDYWGPVCRFAMRSGARDLAGAEEIAARTFEVLLENALLGRWASNKGAKLRSLLCAVVRKSLATQKRTEARREHLRGEVARHVEEIAELSAEADDIFYAAWAEEVVQQAVDSLAVEYCRKNQSDRIRVLYGRLCEGLSMAQVAASLEIAPSTADFYFRDVRERLAERLEEMVRPRIARYCAAEEAATEFAREWEQLGRYLAAHGGLEEAVRRSYELLPGGPLHKATRQGMDRTLARLSSLHPPPGASPSAQHD
jgi:DNA-directed RNA polymerase specialized sigma24 family protein